MIYTYTKNIKCLVFKVEKYLIVQTWFLFIGGSLNDGQYHDKPADAHR